MKHAFFLQLPKAIKEFVVDEEAKGEIQLRKLLKRKHMGERYDLVFDKTKTRITPRTLPAKKIRRVPILMYLGGAGDIGFSFAVPLLLSLYIGSKLDAYLVSKPWATLILMLFGLVVSVITVSRKIRDMIRA